MEKDKAEEKQDETKSTNHPKEEKQATSKYKSSKKTRKKKIIRIILSLAVIVALALATIITVVTVQIIERNHTKDAASKTRKAYNELNSTVGRYSEEAKEKRNLAISDADGNIESIDNLISLLEEMREHNENVKQTFEELESDEMQSFSTSIEDVSRSIE
ncbi:MAG: hypothetical protein ACOCXT_06020, partial [Candidatus Dojkabacteria bacterium]